jgi:hypothetical protein
MIDSQNRLLTRAFEKVFPNRDRQGAPYADFRNLALAARGKSPDRLKACPTKLASY